MNLPQKFLTRLSQIFSSEELTKVLESFIEKKEIAVRVNTLKTALELIKEEITAAKIQWKDVEWIRNVFLIAKKDGRQPVIEAMVGEGKLYYQALSSLFVPVVLAPQETDEVLDMCAAPGSKTTQIAAMMNNRGCIVAVDGVRGRFYKLKSVCALLGAQNVECVFCDGRRFRPKRSFDKILVDAPCSAEGRFRIGDEDSFGYWSPRKIEEMSHKQKGLLMSAGRLLKPGGVMVYSTCTFAPEENEAVVNWFLKKTEGTFHLMPMETFGLKTYPCLKGWNKKIFDPQVHQCVRLFPGEGMDGFFVAKFVKDA